MTQNHPTWYKQAIERNINYIVILYGKAEGVIFCPNNLDKPFKMGGDYGGCFPCDADGALYHYNNFFNKAYTDQVSWFIEFVEKVANDQDFSLDELQIESRQLKVIQGRWPW